MDASIVDVWAQPPVEDSRTRLPEVRRLLEKSGTAQYLDARLEPRDLVALMDEAAIHIGHPWTDEMIGLAWKHDNVYIDTSAYLPRYYPPALVQFMNSYGKHKVMFGTNFPQLRFAECAAQARSLPLKEENLRLFLGGNARRVLGLGG